MKKLNSPISASAALKNFIVQQRNFDEESIRICEAALRALCKELPENEKQLIQLHDALLFSIAYPANQQIYELAEQGMQLLVRTVSEKVLKDENAFYNSGITGSMVCAQFGLLLNKYLLDENLKTLFLSDIDGEQSDLVTQLTQTLDAVEQELMPAEAGYFKQWQKQYLKGMKNKGALLKYFVEATLQTGTSISGREAVFAGFQAYTQFSLDPKLMGLSNGRLPQTNIFYHTQGIQKKCDLETVLYMPKPKQVRLTEAMQETLVRIARGSMASLLRETDTFTYAQTRETELFDMGAGINIALYYMVPEQKFTLQSYVGYLLYKNGVPMAYGGCWIVGRQAAFGVNVLPPYRGGESANVIAQLLRLYKHRFMLSQFTVDPYQIGKGNEDGIQSGAFWFYYKLGFRPMQPHLLELAQSEMAKMSGNKSYRTPKTILRKLAEADIYFAAQGNQKPFIVLTKISDAISSHVVKLYAGNRRAALLGAKTKYRKLCKQKISSDSFLNRVLLCLDALGAFEKLNEPELKTVATAFELKADREALAHTELNKVAKFQKLLNLSN